MSSEGILLWLFLGAAPVVLGIVAQKQKGRTGAAWWFLTFVLMIFFYLATDLFASDLVATYGSIVAGISGAILFGLVPMSIIVATLPARRPDHLKHAE
jgi:hypothetical protein